jgi:hypothetical protein
LIDREDFKGMCERLARVTGRIDQETRDVYYEAFKDFDRNSIYRAMKKAGREHSYYKFPTIAEIMDAVRDTHEGKRPVPTWCMKCNMTGMVMVERNSRTSVFRCDCENGQRTTKKMRLFSEVESMFEAPPDETRRPIVPVEALDALEPGLIFPDGVVVEKTCSVCWSQYKFEHKREMNTRKLKEIHQLRPAVCEACYIDEGVKEGLWKRPAETSERSDASPSKSSFETDPSRSTPSVTLPSRRRTEDTSFSGT